MLLSDFRIAPSTKRAGRQPAASLSRSAECWGTACHDNKLRPSEAIYFDRKEETILLCIFSFMKRAQKQDVVAG